MSVVEELADALAKDVIEAAEAMGEPQLIDEIAKLLLSTSQTTQEAYMTAIRVRLSEKRARAFLRDKVRKFKESGKTVERVDLSSRKILNTTDDNAGGH